MSDDVLLLVAVILAVVAVALIPARRDRLVLAGVLAAVLVALVLLPALNGGPGL